MEQMILLTNTLHEIGDTETAVDFDIGSSDVSSNDFEINTNSIPGDAAGIYLPGTEFGGVFEYSSSSSNSDTVKIKGYTWRGLLTKSIIIPDAGNDYKVVSGDANRVLETMLSNVLGGFFSVPETNSGINITNHKFKLYETTLSGLEEMLSAVGAKLYIHAEKVAAGESVKVFVEAVPATTMTGTVNEDSPLTIKYTYDGMGINHLVCMGKGELQNRLRIDLYVGADGNVSKTKYYTGFDERVEYYDYSSAESAEDLEKYGKKRLLEKASKKTLEINVDDTSHLEIGDNVNGFYAGVPVSATISQKIYKISVDGKSTITYKAKGA